MIRCSVVVGAICALLSGCADPAAEIKPGVITSSSVFVPGVYQLAADVQMDTSVLTIRGNDLILDFSGVVLDGSQGMQPDAFAGIGIRIVDSRNVTIRNLTVKGYKIGLYAEGVDGLVLEDCDLSYNFRQRLGSKWDREALGDWLYYHDNENDEWFRYGAAVYLKQCDSTTVRGLRVTQGQNGLMLVGCNHGLFYNNDIRFNSGLGIGMYRSSDNRIMHNKLDWNVRGYSHGQYARGQDSAGILLYEQCMRNTIAFNSATHSGDGLFLWAGNHTMDTGHGGCNDNVIYGNDFSHSVANGIEVTFSSNILVNNKLDDSRYGIWGGYSHHTYIAGNTMTGCEFGIAIEHGNNNQIVRNEIRDCTTGIQLWERDRQPEGWGFAEQRDVSSRAYHILDNVISGVKTAYQFSGTDSITMDDNRVDQVDSILIGAGNQFVDIAPGAVDFDIPDPLPDGQNAFLPDETLRGRQYMIVNEWGPYNFAYPLLWLRNVDGVRRTFSLLGPKGDWSLAASRGFINIDPQRDTLPATVHASRVPDSTSLIIDLIYTGEAFIDQLGDTVKRGEEYHFGYEMYDPQLSWNVTFFSYDEGTSTEVLKQLFLEFAGTAGIT
ncbi:MAG: right-handed parallel beta-helix repeat-containing protein, partial [Saprospiraceae bacterium]|nr:right-handed parallel beta-helix repeat-containing protein [Saprospiraceae bacterium]